MTNAYELKLFAFWDALTRQRTDGALVRVITPVYEFEELEEAEGRLQGFVGDIAPVLGEYIPGWERWERLERLDGLERLERLDGLER